MTGLVVCSYSIGMYACEGVGVKCVGTHLRERDGGVEYEYVCGGRSVSSVPVLVSSSSPAH